jgi:hypothetical protein
MHVMAVAAAAAAEIVSAVADGLQLDAAPAATKVPTSATALPVLDVARFYGYATHKDLTHAELIKLLARDEVGPGELVYVYYFTRMVISLQLARLPTRVTPPPPAVAARAAPTHAYRPASACRGPLPSL